jgi:transposase
MTIEILNSPERRRRWSTEEKARIVAEAKAPGAMVAAIARRHGVSRSLVYTWRRELGEVDLPDLVPVVVEAPIGSTGTAPSPPARRGGAGTNVAIEAGGSIEIALAGNVRVTLHGQVDAKGLRAVLAALRSS